MTYTHTYTYTRTSVLVDQVDIFLRSSGIGDAARKRVVDAITEKWIEAVGVFVVQDGRFHLVRTRQTVATSLAEDAQ